MTSDKKNLTRRIITVFEYGFISASEKCASIQQVEKIPKAAFEYLKGLCLSEERESGHLRFKLYRGMEVLQMQNYAGVLICPDGTQIEILPKIAKVDSQSDGAETARQSLLMMLKTLKQFRFLETETTNVKKQKMPLMEVFIAQFLHEVNQLIKKGIKSEYVREQNNGAFLKGKLLHSQQLKFNTVNRHRFFVEYDSYHVDTPANRLIRTAISVVNKIATSHPNKKLAQELYFTFEEVPPSVDYKNDLSGVSLHRGMKHYDNPIKWAKLILDGFSPQSMRGTHHAYSLLFPMEAVFESFVAKYLAKNLPASVTLSTQIQKESLVTYDTQRYFRLKPDLYLMHGEASTIVMDTKWKLIDQSKSAGADKFGLSQTDFYQMLSYGFKYLNCEGLLVLIYPRTETFQKPFEHYFAYDEEHKLRLKVLPFDVSANSKERLSLTDLGIGVNQRKPRLVNNDNPTVSRL